LYKSLGYGVLAVEYPGYGAAPGKTSETSIYESAEAALKWLGQRRVILSGQSLGSGVAVEMARRGFGEKLVLISPYTSMADVAAFHFPWLPVRLLLKHKFDSASKKVEQPVLIIHGTDDEVVPFALGEKLSKHFPRARFIPIQGAHHNDIWRYAPAAIAAAL
jgi:fermentation-respiration switch protein FrsA (DUF1100 family)